MVKKNERWHLIEEVTTTNRPGSALANLPGWALRAWDEPGSSANVTIETGREAGVIWYTFRRWGPRRG